MNLQGAVELKGFVMKGEERDSFRLLPTGNHRNQQSVILTPAKPGAPARQCPRCKGKLNVLVHTFPTEFYKEWEHEAKKTISSKYPAGMFTEPVIVCAWILGGAGFMESRDWDNVQKCIGDALEASGCLPQVEDSKGKTIDGKDDVRAIKGWRTAYLSREEHAALTGGASGKPKDLRARLFIKLVAASEANLLVLD